MKMMGINTEAELKKCLLQHECHKTQGKFVCLQEKEGFDAFRLDAQRVATLSQMAQYLEKQW